MHRIMLKSKLHRVIVTHCELDYEGSCAIDQDLLDAADIYEYQQIEIYNVSNGERFTTYAICAQRGTGLVSVNGAAAHRAHVGDILIVACYAGCSESDLAGFKPKLVYVDGSNRITHKRSKIPVQLA